MTLQDWRALTPDSYRQMPWKNGLGKTTELATAAVASATASDIGLLWRISRATIAASGPFSQFPGYDRVICHLGGGDVHLTHNDSESFALKPFRPYAFSGDELTSATLDGPSAEDFNLFTLRSACRGMLMFDDLPMGTPHLLAAGISTTHFVYVLNGSIEVKSEHPKAALTADKLGSVYGPASQPLQLKATKPNTSYLLASITLGT